ncbi:MAG: hypothetical protein QOF76_4638 [Solirubrobacteraceae bacterium]|nr:hypothetical protein [Solirubrobacteraceae bacterium]
MNPTQKGAIAEAAVFLETTRLGLPVMRPSVEGLRYDLVIDVGTRLLRVQVKWANWRESYMAIRTSTCRHTPAGYVRTMYTPDQIDGFAIYCDHNRECYWMPIEEVAGVSYIHLRFQPTRNNQQQLVKWARDYPFGAVAQLGERLAGSQKVRGSSPLSSIA